MRNYLAKIVCPKRRIYMPVFNPIEMIAEVMMSSISMIATPVEYLLYSGKITEIFMMNVFYIQP